MKLKPLALALLIGMSGSAVAEQTNHAADGMAFLNSFFTGAPQHTNFNRTEEFFPIEKVAPSSQPYQWPEGAKVELPATYVYEGKTLPTADFLSGTDTVALLVIKDGQIRYENYWLTGAKDQHWLTQSVSKSVVSALLGLAVEEGLIKSIEDSVSDYVPELKGSGYEGVSIKNVLQMSSGARWLEDYTNRDSEVFRLGMTMRDKGSWLDFAAGVQPELEPGTFNRYNSADTLILGLVLEKVTGKTLATLTAEKLWEPMGGNYTAFWDVDGHGNSRAFGGFNAAARDLAMLGEAYRLDGKFNGKQIIPASWVKASITPDAPHLVPGKRKGSDYDWGYGYQWWLMDGNYGDYSAIGIYNQWVWVSPNDNTVIVKLSASRNYGTEDSETSYREVESIDFFRTVAQSLK